MKKLFLTLLLAFCLPAARGQGKKISDYQNTGTIFGTNLFIVADPTGILGGGPTNYNISLDQLLIIIHDEFENSNYFSVNVNGSPVTTPNLQDSGSVTWTTSGTNIIAASSGGGGLSLWFTNSDGSISFTNAGFQPITIATNGGVFVDAGSLQTWIDNYGEGPFNAVLAAYRTNQESDILLSSSDGTDTSFASISATADNADIYLANIDGSSAVIHTAQGGTQYIELSPFGGFDAFYVDQTAHLKLRAVDNPQVSINRNGQDTVNLNADQLVFYDFATDNNIVQISPRIGDGGTPYLFNTTVEHTTGDLLEIRNNNVARFVVDAFGNISAGQNTGMQTGNLLSIQNGDGAFNLNYSLSLNLVPPSGANSPTINMFDASGQGTEAQFANPVGNGYLLRYFGNGASGPFLVFNPEASDGVSLYTFDSTTPHTTGNLLEVMNNGTNVFNIDLANQGAFLTLNSLIGVGYFVRNLDSPSYDGFMNSVSVSLGSGAFLASPYEVDGNAPYKLDTLTTHTTGNLLTAKNNGAEKFAVNFSGGIITGVPNTATNALPFKVGQVAAGIGLTVIATNYLQIEINGTAYKVGLVQ